MAEAAGSNKINVGIMLGSGAIVASTMLMAWWWKVLPEELPWFYSLPWGEGQLVSKEGFAVSLAVLGAVFALDVWLAKRLVRKDAVLGVVIIWFGVGVVGVYLASFYRVLQLML